MKVTNLIQWPARMPVGLDQRGLPRSSEGQSEPIMYGLQLEYKLIWWCYPEYTWKSREFWTIETSHHMEKFMELGTWFIQ